MPSSAPAAAAQANATSGEGYAEQVRGRFLNEYRQVIDLAIPPGYAFQINGNPTPPNLMQRQFAVRVREHKRVGNWSGTGVYGFAQPANVADGVQPTERGVPWPVVHIAFDCRHVIRAQHDGMATIKTGFDFYGGKTSVPLSYLQFEGLKWNTQEVKAVVGNHIKFLRCAFQGCAFQECSADGSVTKDARVQ